MATAIRFTRATGDWRLGLGVLSLALATELLLVGRDVADMAAIWWRISTYQHCLFILPIVGWLIWQRRHEVAATATPAGWTPGLALVFGAALLWLMGEAAGVALVRHLSVVLLVQATVITVLGPAVARAIAFPLFYLIFLVPFGDEFVAPMQTVTAKIAMPLLHVTGVPATIDGVFITIPKGWFEVAEACSGVMFLVAMVAYGALVAHVCFRRWSRRIAFMAAAVIVPVLANGIRAFGTIYAAHLTSVKFATGFDHIVYGWFFFAFVTVVIMLGAWRFFDRRIGDSWLSGASYPTVNPKLALPLAALLSVVTASLPVAWNAWSASAGRANLVYPVELPSVPGWRRTNDLPKTPWQPRFDGADHILLGRYADAAGHRVDVALALYGWQEKGRAIVAFGQGAANDTLDWRWAANAAPMKNGFAERILGPGAIAREAATFWIVGGSATGSKPVVKLRTMAARLTGGDQSAATLIVSAEGPDARASIDAFLVSLGDPALAAERLIAHARAH